MIPAIHGHRGARGRRPENTLAAIEYALRRGADGVEVDLCVTADDAVVLHHDLRLNPDTTRDANGAWIVDRVPIRDLPLDALHRCDVGRLRPGGDYALQFAGQTPVDGARPPTLDECVERFRRWGGDGAVLNLELKSADQDAPPQPGLTPPPEEYIRLVLENLARLKFPASQLFVQSFDWRLMRLARRLRPEWKIGFTRRRPWGPADLERARRHGADVFSCDYRGLSEALLAEARACGLEVWAWTVNEPDDMRKMADWGVATITTDYPGRCRRVLAGE